MSRKNTKHFQTRSTRFLEQMRNIGRKDSKDSQKKIRHMPKPKKKQQRRSKKTQEQNQRRALQQVWTKSQRLPGKINKTCHDDTRKAQEKIRDMS